MNRAVLICAFLPPVFCLVFGGLTLLILAALGVPENGDMGGFLGVGVGMFWLIVGNFIAWRVGNS